ncbi:hypothetical protein [Cellulomonas endometrii]|uniref:hypothetical protein n=1 Tax=Cellulomonas endometrii TaxID=3036301 RepID=UPI0024AE6610|nr:hypothetical protein [Cellulomonas endometrii]
MQARPSWHARRATSALLAGTLAAGATTALVLAPEPPPATAAIPAAGITITPAGYGPVHLGPIDGPSGAEEHGYCLQARLPASGPSDVPLSVTAVDDAPLAAALARHRYAADDLTQAALGYAAHQRQERPGGMAGGVVESVKLLIAAATPQAVKDRAAALLNQAAAEAGPYAATAGTVTGQGRRTGAIRGIVLRSAAGQPVVGAPFTVTLSGPAVLDASGGSTFRGTTGSAPVDLTWTATGNGDVSYRVVFDDAWRTTVTVFDVGGGRQDQLSYGNRPGHDPSQIVEDGPVFPVVKDFRPRATTTVQDVRVQDGDPLVDRLEFSAAPGDVWVDLDGDPVDVPADVTWYGPFLQPQAQAAVPPAGAPVAGVERVVADGPGGVVTPGTVRATGDGFYTAVVTIRKADAGPFAEYIREDFAAPYFEEAETAVNRFELKHESQAREFNVVPGGRAFDRITVTGYPEDHGEFGGLGRWGADLGQATVTVHGPLAQLPTTAEVPPGTPVLWTGTVDAANGVYEVGYEDPIVVPATATHPGGDYYVFVYSFAGDDRVEPFVSRFDDVREAFYVPGDPVVVVPPTVVTRAQEQAAPGETIHDLALVTGTTADGDHLVFEAFGPQDPAAAPRCDDTTSLWVSDPVPVARPGLYESGTTPAPDRPGRVYWVETLIGGDGAVKHRGECGIPSETTTVTDGFTVRTTATAAQDRPVAGVELWDVVTVTGTPPAGAVTVVDLFAASPGQELVCDEPVWTSAPLALSEGAGEYATDRYVAGEPGTYGFVERTSTADGEPLSAGRCGEPSETLTVAAPEPVAPESPLAVTGADVGRWLATAVVLVVAGAVVVGYRARVRRALDAAGDPGEAGPWDRISGA